MSDKQINVINKCYSRVNPAVMKSVTSWGKDQTTDKFKTFFIDRLTGKFLGEYPPYDDPENPNSITFPNLKVTITDKNNKKIVCSGVNLRSIYNGQQYLRSPDAKPNEDNKVDYPNHFKEGNVNEDTVSNSIVFLGDDYQTNFEKIISIQESGENKEQSAVIIYNERNNSITCKALPDTINREGLNEASLKATADAIPALTFFMSEKGKRVYTQLLPNGDIENFREYFDDPYIPEVTYIKIKEIVEKLPEFLPKDLWGLAMFKYIIDNEYYQYYSINVNNYESEIIIVKATEMLLKRIAFDYRLPIITLSHTHPFVAQKVEMSKPGSFTYTSSTTTLFSTISEQDAILSKNTGLPDLVITFVGSGYISERDKHGNITHKTRQKVEKFEIVYKNTGQKIGRGGNIVYDAKLITKSKSEFYSKKELILFEDFITKYYD